MKSARFSQKITTVAIGLLMSTLSAQAATPSASNKNIFDCEITSRGAQETNSNVLDIVEISTSNGAETQLYPRTNGTNQRFLLVYAGTDPNKGTAWYISPMHSSKCLHVEQAKVKNGAKVVQATCDISTYWWVKSVGNGNYSIKTHYNETYGWDITNVSTAQGARLQLWGYTAGKSNKDIKFSNCKNNQGAGVSPAG